MGVVTVVRLGLSALFMLMALVVALAVLVAQVARFV